MSRILSGKQAYAKVVYELENNVSITDNGYLIYERTKRVPDSEVKNKPLTKNQRKRKQGFRSYCIGVMSGKIQPRNKYDITKVKPFEMIDFNRFIK